MKVMIDIPEEIWEKENFCDYFGAWSEKLQEVIKSGTVVYESEKYKNYVSRQSVKELIRSGISTDTEADQDYVCELIDELPPVTPKPKIGKWKVPEITVEGHGKMTIKGCICSTCEHYFEHEVNFKYCPMCGSYNGGEKMRPIDADELLKY